MKKACLSFAWVGRLLWFLYVWLQLNFRCFLSYVDNVNTLVKCNRLTCVTVDFLYKCACYGVNCNSFAICRSELNAIRCYFKRRSNFFYIFNGCSIKLLNIPKVFPSINCLICFQRTHRNIEGYICVLAFGEITAFNSRRCFA